MTETTTALQTHTLHLEEVTVTIELDHEGVATLRLRIPSNRAMDDVVLTPEDYGDLNRFWNDVTKADE